MGNFYNMGLSVSTLDAIIAGDAPKKIRVRTSSAKEELDNNSSQEEFMNTLSDAVAFFIRENRNAFDLDDAEAVSEFAKVVQLEEIQSRVLSSLQKPEDEGTGDELEDASSDDIPLDDTDTDTDTSSGENEDDDLVSEDVMAMLDKEE